MPYEKGDIVEALWEGSEWYPAKVRKVAEDGTYELKWEDGSKTAGVPESNIRPPAGGEEAAAAAAPAAPAPPAAAAPPASAAAAAPAAAAPPPPAPAGRRSPPHQQEEAAAAPRQASDVPAVERSGASSDVPVNTVQSHQISRVMIPRTEEREGKVIYAIDVVAATLSAGGRWSISRRYSDFAALHKKVAQLGFADKFLHSFPGKTVFKASPEQVRERKELLEKWLNELIVVSKGQGKANRGGGACSPDLLEFLKKGT